MQSFTIPLSLFIVLISLALNSKSSAQEDPYIWLEDVEGEKSMNWVKRQNSITEQKFKDEPGFDELKQQFLATYNDKGKIIYPSVVNEFVYNFWKDEQYVRGVWRRTKKADFLSGNYVWEILLNLDELSELEGKKWVFQGVNWLEPDNKMCLISLSDGGTDENEIREFNVATKQFVKDGFHLPKSKGGAAWISADELLVTRVYDEKSATTSGYPMIAKRWKRGTPFGSAEVVYSIPDSLMGLWGSTDWKDGKMDIYLSKSVTFYNHSTYFFNGSSFVELSLPNDSDMEGEFKGEVLVTLNSDWTVDKKTFKAGSLVSVNKKLLREGKLETKLVMEPDSRSSISGIMVVKDKVLLNVLRNVQNVLFEALPGKDAWTIKEMEAPAFGKISFIDGDYKETGYFYEFNNFITPTTLFYVDGAKKSIIQVQNKLFNADDLVVNQYEAKSMDGTMIPYFIIHKKGMELNGQNPTLVYAYGGFNISQKPNYNATNGIGWLEKGGVYVVASIRGGGEFGPSWHKAAIKENRQNAYNDFYAVCEDLIARKITGPANMGAFGWSNGGLMAGVVATQRPDLFNAVIIGAPLLDMKRFNKMLAGASWMGEYGNPDIPEEWDYIKKYSPYHNLVEGKEYPEVLFVTSTKDDRVHPAHARKMAARMIEQGHKMFYYETIEGGHGASSTNEQTAFNQALMFSYLWMKLK